MVDSKHKWKAWLYLSPALVLLAIFTVYPIINTIRLAFLEDYGMMKAISGATFEFGFGNFEKVVEYRNFLTCLKNTVLLCVITVPISTILALLIAVILNSIGPLRRVLQTIYFLPYVTNSIAIGMVFAAMFNMVGSAFGGENEIIITAGIGRKPGQTRLELGQVNVGIAKDIARNIMKYNDNPLILCVSNPADVITAAVLEETGLRRGQVIGSGTSLDSARFRYFISEALHVDVEDINAYVLGEHGDSQVPMWSSVSIAGIPLASYEEQMGIKLDKEEITRKTKYSGADIIKGKGATFYGVAMAVSNITERIMNDQQGIVPVAHLMGQQYGKWANVCFSMPCIIGSDGIEKTMNLPMSDEEREALDKSVEIIADMQKQLGIFKDLKNPLE